MKQKKLTIVFLIILSLFNCTNLKEEAIANSKEITIPEKLAQEQLDAYNKRDIDAFLKPYADDVEIYNFPNELSIKGKEDMRKVYNNMFDKTPNLHCTLVSRMVQGNKVIDQESVQFGERIVKAIAIYHIENKKIKKVYFIN